MNIYPFGKAISYPFVRLFFKMKYEGLEHIPQGGGYILACNHRSNYDPILLAHKVPIQVRYLAKAELLKNRIARFVMNGLGVIPIKRGEGDSGALESAVEIIQNGGVLGMFPEGKRSKDGVPLRPRSGVALIAGKIRADILPVAISYGKGVRFRSPVTVRYGPLIPSDKLGVDLDSPATIRAASKLIMGEIIALMDPLPGLQFPPGEGEA